MWPFPNPLDLFGDAFSSVAGWAWDKVTQGVYTWFASGVLMLMEWVWGVLDSATTPRLTDAWFAVGADAAARCDLAVDHGGDDADVGHPGRLRWSPGTGRRRAEGRSEGDRRDRADGRRDGRADPWGGRDRRRHLADRPRRHAAGAGLHRRSRRRWRALWPAPSSVRWRCCSG